MNSKQKRFPVYQTNASRTRLRDLDSHHVVSLRTNTRTAELEKRRDVQHTQNSSRKLSLSEFSELVPSVETLTDVEFHTKLIKLSSTLECLYLSKLFAILSLLR